MGTLQNSVQLIGRPGMDPEVKNINNMNKKVAKFSLATNNSYYNDKNELVKDTSWHNIVAWGKIAERVEKVVKKGKMIALEGRIQTRSWEDKGVKKYMTEIVMNDFLLIERTNDEEHTSTK